MNKTVNINLAGTFFHIDEDAFFRLQRYLEAIKRSFTDSQGRDEIVNDIETRIAELFTEKMQHDKMVISAKQVDEVITIMGQPEDYLVDDEIFEDEPKRKKTSSTSQGKKLYRDRENQYISGVAAGLGHYLGIDAVWIRILWVLLATGSGGGFILIYILLWAIVPEAVTTSEKLSMRGKPVNISNIEQKIKEGFEDVSEKVKNVDYASYGEKVKSSSQTFFDTLSSIIMFFFKVFGKFIGVLLVIIGATTLISLIIAMFGVSMFDFVDAPWIDYISASNIGAPFWVVSLLSFFAVGIPFFFVFLLGLKLLVSNLKSIGTVAKLTLLVVWLAAIIFLAFLGVRQATERAYEGEVISKREFVLHSTDTLFVQMNPKFNDHYDRYRHYNFDIRYNEKDQKVLYSNNLSITVNSTSDSVAYLQVNKMAKGSDYRNAKNRAEAIQYGAELKNNRLTIDTYHTSLFAEKFRNQRVRLTLYVPEGMTIFFDKNTEPYTRNYGSDLLKQHQEGYFLNMHKGELLCEACPMKESNNNDWEYLDEDGVNINQEGVHIKTDDFEIKIDDKGIKVDEEEVKMQIDSKGIRIKTDN
jgi:phage shock protein PspC (stress-responsive transcriptional regulator)